MQLPKERVETSLRIKPFDGKNTAEEMDAFADALKSKNAFARVSDEFIDGKRIVVQEVILVKLGEIVLKGLNRRTFEDRLLRTFAAALRGATLRYSCSPPFTLNRRTRTRILTKPRSASRRFSASLRVRRACV